MEPELLAMGMTVVGAVAGGGVAWGSARARIRNVETITNDIDITLTEHKAEDVSQHTQIVQRLTRIETLLQQINKRVS